LGLRASADAHASPEVMSAGAFKGRRKVRGVHCGYRRAMSVP